MLGTAYVNMTQSANLVELGDPIRGYATALAVEIPLLVLAVTTVVLRVFSRLAIKRKLAADDVLIIIGTAAAVARTVISCMSADDNWGYDRRGPDRATEVPYYQHIFERRIAYLFAVTFIRFSVLAYYLRIFPPSMYSLRRGCYVLLALALALFVEVFVVLIVYCKDIRQLWTDHWSDFTGSQCFSSAVYSYSAAIGDSVIDSMIFTLPIPYVWRLSQLRTRQRLGLVVVFGLGFIVCVVALLQIPFIKKREGSTTYFGTTVNILVAIQVSFAIVAASLPDLRALVARTFPNFSPLHHRSIATAAEHGNDGRAEVLDEEKGIAIREMPEDRRITCEGKRVFRKPDWMRSSIPASLLSTTITQNDAIPTTPQIQVPQSLQTPEKATN
ncbi:hypothetical protein HBI38_178310 [Parastagonospora nodorum]|nr:hypothetical protein HBI09_081070 [Parastagonospora nodorum]KAH4218059.1 hypothetical protein HBI06_206730 [Parastagonospora nodorum]KAH4243001.1 hypothetical protein HBI05_092170 [Parastagonospora nodorum]KAH4988282.1 hypothetical protein HBI76_088430 [Parastagonospora nodorum]KAH5014205.1 hypothetical protein HBI77_071020 [Parastagonospora nodorum]